MALKMNAQELTAFLNRVFPQVASDFVVLNVHDGGVDVQLAPREIHLRPGGTVSGPSLFGLADVSMYLAVLTKIGPKALAVTTNCSIDFMRKPDSDTALIARARLLKMGRSLAVGDVLIAPEGRQDAPVARASLTYALPPAGSAADIDA